jgi:hypothetical protein
MSSRTVFVLGVLVLAAEARAVSPLTPGAGILAGPVLRTVDPLLGGVLKYLGARFNDAADMFEMDAGFGLGAKVGIEAALVRIGAGKVQSQRFGFDGRQLGSWSEEDALFGMFPLSLLFAPFELVKGQGDLWEGLAVGGFEMGTIGVERIRRSRFATTTVLYREARAAGGWHERPGDIASIGGEAFLGILGLRARLKPLEAVDFLIGFIGFDLDPMLAHPNAEGTRR